MLNYKIEAVTSKLVIAPDLYNDSAVAWTGKIYAADSYVLSTNNRVYWTAKGGNSTIAPTGDFVDVGEAVWVAVSVGRKYLDISIDTDYSYILSCGEGNGGILLDASRPMYTFVGNNGEVSLECLDGSGTVYVQEQ